MTMPAQPNPPNQPHQAQPQQQPPQPNQPTGWIDLTIQGNQMTSNMIVPTALLNGYRMPTQYGRNLFPVPPGRWTVEMYTQWTWRFGKASMTFDVPEGQTVPVFYAAPLTGFSKGAMGHEKQKRRGALALVLLVVVVAVVVLGLGLLTGNL